MIKLTDFSGLWAMSREIDDVQSGARSLLTGECRFSPDDAGGFEQHERGLLQMPVGAVPLTAERRYLWRQTGPRITVFFEDGRFFHDFDPNAPRPSAEHDCAPDAYAVRYDFSAWPEWTARWRVRGPRKDYISLTRFSRL